jgi:hypothetical protein
MVNRSTMRNSLLYIRQLSIKTIFVIWRMMEGGDVLIIEKATECLMLRFDIF